MATAAVTQLRSPGSFVDSSPDQPPQVKSRRKKCKVRCSYSKGAFLVLVWIGLILSAEWSMMHFYDTLFQGLQGNGSYYYALISILFCILLAPLIGWLADVYCGHYKMFKVGVLLTFLAAVLLCFCMLALKNVIESRPSFRIVNDGLSIVAYLIASAGFVACSVTALQLGLDQMPDASSANLSSFVNWFLFSQFVGLWVFNTVYIVLWNCSDKSLSLQLYSFLPALCLCICCCTVFTLAPKWLIIEPKCPQSLRMVYEVLKFAAKHKAPLNRSALTYWEEGIPSRLDLGKSRYGGPFTTEQVENVKTFFRIMIIILPIIFIIISASPANNVTFSATPSIPSLNACSSTLVYSFTYSPWWCSVVATLINKLVIHPLLQYKFPSILKCIGITSFLVLLSNTVLLILTVIDLHYSLGLSLLLCGLRNVLAGIFLQFLLIKLCEFVCAQSPYNMRSLLSGYTFLMFFIAFLFSKPLLEMSDGNILCHGKHCILIQNSVVAAMSLIGFVLFCALARWYKKRVRDEEYNTYTVVEEIYDRYLSNN